MMKGLQAATSVTLVFHPFALLFSSCQSLLHLGANPSSRRAVRPHRVLLKELVVEHYSLSCDKGCEALKKLE